MTDQPTPRKRAALDFGDFAPKKAPAAKPKAHRTIAEEEGFTSRQAKDLPKPKKVDGRSLRATGRREQLNIAIKPETKSRFWGAAKDAGFTTGEEFLLAMLEVWEDKNPPK